MGFIFNAEQTNIAAYLTTPNHNSPRISWDDMYTFLSILGGAADQRPEQLFTSSAEARVIGRPEWIDKVKNAATRALTHLRTLSVDRRDWLSDEAIVIELAELKVLFGSYHLLPKTAETSSSWT